MRAPRELDSLREPGVRPSDGSRPLEPVVRRRFERMLGHDFARVRVHTDERAAGSARALGASAYTVGRDVVFDTGRYAPTTATGARLLAHELVHVVQADRSPHASGATRVASPHGGAERAARDAAEAAVSGRSVRTDELASSAEPGALYRQEASSPGLKVSPMMARLLGSEVIEGFSFDGDKIPPSQRTKVAVTAARILSLRRTYPRGTVLVVGHTDLVGGEGYNVELAQRRADAVREALVRAGVPADIVETSTHGETRPAVATERAEPRNRRVEVLFEPEQPGRLLEPPELTLTPPAPEKKIDLFKGLPEPETETETESERISRIVREPAPEPYKPPTVTEHFWKKVDDTLDPLVRKVPPKYRETVRDLAKTGIRKGTVTAVEAALDESGASPDVKKAITKTVEALLEEAKRK